MAPTIASPRRASEDEFAVFDLTTSETKKSTDIGSNGSWRLDHSLVGFDPMLELSESRDDEVPWNDQTGSPMEHPPLSSPSFESDCDYQEVPKSCSNELRELAAELSRARPRALTKEEEIEITLGDSPKESSVKNERKLEKKAARQKTAPSTPEGKKQVKTLNVETPSPKGRKKSFRRALSSRLSPRPKNKKSALADSTRSSPRRLVRISESNSPIKAPRLKKMKSVSTLLRRKSSSSPGLDIPTLAKPNPTSFLKDSSSMALKTSEQDPSPHQVAIPSANELFAHAKLCAILDSYEKLDKSFDFNDFCGVDLQVLNQAVYDDSQNEIPGMTPVHKILLQQLLNCSKGIHVEGFFTHGKEKSRVGIFSTKSNSGFVVVYRGTTEQQQKPARQRSIAVNLHPTDNVMPVYSPLRDAYFELETHVYKLLDKLLEEDPFSNVTFVGHSFGGALATVGAVRFASARPMQCFACHTFGSPKVGSHEFRQEVNTLPNLKIMRVEYGNDPNTGNPMDLGPLKWEHVGHSITIHGSVGTSAKLPTSPAMAYRFDNKKPVASLLNMRISQNSIQDYVGAMEPFATKHLPWITTFVGEDGQGVHGKDNEDRLMV
jgi:hypothetical protein